nr:hypothetical protein [uncultured Niameybacter sp.]
MSTKQLVTGSILTAITLLILYMTLLIPTNTLALLTLASITVPVALIRENIKTSLLVYITSSLLGVILLPLNISLLYILFFGCYGLIKHFIERLNRLPLEWLLKFIFFNIMLIVGYTFFENVITPGSLDGLIHLINKLLPNLNFPPILIAFILAQGCLVVYDYAFTLLIDFYYTYLDKHL